MELDHLFTCPMCILVVIIYSYFCLPDTTAHYMYIYTHHDSYSPGCAASIGSGYMSDACNLHSNKCTIFQLC